MMCESPETTNSLNTAVPLVICTLLGGICMLKVMQVTGVDKGPKALRTAGPWGSSEASIRESDSDSQVSCSGVPE